MSARTPSRILVVLLALWQSLKLAGKHRPDSHPERILVAHHLLLGDTLTLTPLLAKLRQMYPRAEIVMTVASTLQSCPATIASAGWPWRLAPSG
jgi:3-deoxy-D-manno-octulosonic-acid transferase